jgi:hypothetical protein
VYCQVIVPKQNRRDVMGIAHESIMVGYLTTRRTVDRFTAELYRPGITSDIKRYCRLCDICQRTVPKWQQIRAPLGKMPVIDIPLRRVSVDIVGPLVPSIVMGPLTGEPYISSNGETIELSCGTSLYANKAGPTYLSLSLGLSAHKRFDISFDVSLNHLTNPLHMG